MKHISKFKLISFQLVFLLLAVTIDSKSQEIEKQVIKATLIEKHTDQTVWLRWAPNTPSSWLITNNSGWWVERIMMPTETEPGDKKYVFLNELPLKPLPLNDWKLATDTNKFAAIAAQMLYGESVKLTGKSETLNIYNKSQEQESRFSFALTAAEQDFNIAQMLGLGFVDNNILPNRIYVYRVFPDIKDTTFTVDTVGVVVNLKEKYELPIINDLNAEVNDTTVTLQWPISYHRGFYSSYAIEKQIGGEKFERLNDVPLVSVSRNENQGKNQFYNDNHPVEGDTVFYRVKGKSPFGNYGPSSEPVKVVIPMQYPAPEKLKYSEITNSQISVEWEFPAKNEYKISGFEIYMSDNLKDTPSLLSSISPSLRNTVINIQESEFYLSVFANGIDGSIKKSYPVLVQIADSIPPIQPVQLSGKISQTGLAIVNWQRGDEPDLFGYRVYASSNLTSEFDLISKEFVRDTTFSWDIALSTLSRWLYVKVMAYDFRFNHSEFSDIIKLQIPDTIPPSAPVLKTCNKIDGKINFEWIPSGSGDVAFHSIIIKSVNEETVDTIARIEKSEIKNFTWSEPISGEWQFFVAATDSSGNTSLSEQKFTYKIQQDFSSIIPAFEAKANYNKGGVELNFKINSDTKWILIYRIIEDSPPRLLNTIESNIEKYVDRSVEVGKHYTYFIQLKNEDGKISNYSKEIKIDY